MGIATSIVLVVALGVVLILVGAAFACWAGMDLVDYRDAVIPLVVGIAAGVPVAIWLARLGERALDARSRNEARQRRRSVLAVIRAELSGAKNELTRERAERPRPRIVPYLKTEAWRALSSSGELRWIDSPELVAKLARAYHRIGTTNELERLHVETTLGPVQQTTRLLLEDQDKHTIAAIDVAVAGINEAEADLPTLDTASSN